MLKLIIGNMKTFQNIKFSLLIFSFLGIIGIINAQGQPEPSPLLKTARQELPGAFKNEQESIILYNKINDTPNPESLLKGYIGAVNIARARHASITEKRKFLKTGIALLEQAIREKPNNTELLFLRLTIQTKLPSFLGYHENIDEDKKFVLANFNTTPSPLKERIARFIMKSEDFTEEEKAMIK